jgi:hypothetical protein
VCPLTSSSTHNRQKTSPELLPIRFSSSIGPWTRYAAPAFLRGTFSWPKLDYRLCQCLRCRQNCSERTLPTVSSAANDVSHQLDELSGILTKYEGMSRKNSPPFPVKEDRKYFYEENTYTLQSSLGWGLNYTLKDLRNELTAARFNLGQYQTPTSHSQ